MKIMINALMETKVRKKMLTFEMEYIKARDLTNSLWNVCSQSTEHFSGDSRASKLGAGS